MFAGILFVSMLALNLGGCAVPQGQLGDAPQEHEDVLLPQVEQVAALKNEQEMDYLGAYLYWRQALELVQGKLASLNVNLQEIADSYVEQGIRLYNNKDGKQAVASFLEALRYDPTNEKALHYLKEKFAAETFIPCPVAEQDSFAAIALRVYGSADKAYLVPIFTKLACEDKLVAGTELQLPQLDSFFSRDLIDYKRDLLKARKLYRDKKYSELLPVAEKLHADIRGDAEASFLVNSAHVALGRVMQDERNYQEALSHYKKVDSQFRDMRGEIAALESQSIDTSVAEKQAEDAGLLQQAREMYGKRQYHEALALLQQLDPPTNDSRVMLAKVHKAMDQRADSHYKQGVSFFIEDKLNAAIAQWEQALSYNPAHQKAQENIVKARKLLEKVSSIK